MLTFTTVYLLALYSLFDQTLSDKKKKPLRASPLASQKGEISLLEYVYLPNLPNFTEAQV